MKKVVLVLMAVVMTAGVVQAALQNPSFEISGVGTPSGWTRMNGEAGYLESNEI